MASMSNTKKEILDELDTVKSLVEAKDAELEKLAETNGKGKKQHLQAVKQIELTKIADNTDPTDLSTFRISISDKLQDLEKVISEKLDAKKAVEELLELKKEELNTHHDILAGANTLEVILISIRDSEAKYQKNLKLMEGSFKLREEVLDTSHEQKVKDLDQTYGRLKDDFQYTFNKDKKIKRDEAEQEALQKQRKIDDTNLKIYEDIAKRTSDLTSKEEEFKTLKIEVENHPEQLKKAVEEAVKKSEASSDRSSFFKTSTLETKHKAEISIANSKLESVTTHRNELNDTIAEVQAKLQEAYKRNTELATSAITASSAQKIIVNTDSTRAK